MEAKQVKQKNDLYIFIGYVTAISLFANTVVLHLIPRLVAQLFKLQGVYLDSSNLATKYCMGIGVRAFGLLIFWLIISRSGFTKLFSHKVTRGCLIISWAFYLYILANFEVGAVSQMRLFTVLLMIIEAFMIGLYEEVVFRGTLLPLFLQKWGNSRKNIYLCVVCSSAIFGLVHLTNLLAGANPIAVLTQVCYTTIMGVAFSALFLRTNGNLLWCALLHGLYDMASGFGDFTKATQSPQIATQVTKVEILPYILNLGLFIPLLFYGLFLLRKVTKVDTNTGIIELS